MLDLFDRVLKFQACPSQCRYYLVLFSSNEIMMVSRKSMLKPYHKLVDLLLCMCCRNVEYMRKVL